MNMLSVGMPSTLGSYLTLCNLFFGDESPQAKFIRDKVKESPEGLDEEVIAEESQMMYLLASLNDITTAEDHMSDKGYSVGTKEGYDAFVEKRSSGNLSETLE